MTLWTDQWTRKFLGLLFQIRLRGASQGCRNLLRTSARESGTGKEPRIRTVRQLAAAAGDGWLGSVGSPGQLETSLNSGYTVGPCNSYLEGPTPVLWACCFAHRAFGPAYFVVVRGEKAPSAHSSSARRAARADAPSSGRDSRRSQLRGSSRSDPLADLLLNVRPDAADVGNARARPMAAHCTRCNVCSVTVTHVHVRSYTR